MGLKNAINSCNTNGQNDTINLAANGTYVLTIVDNASQGATGLPVIGVDYDGSNSHTLIINGNSATITRSTAASTPEFRLLRVQNTLSATISRVTFTNGLITNGDGGAIHTNGYLILNECTIRNNSAGGGGGIMNHLRDLELNYCTLNNNTALSSGGGGMKINGGNVGLNTCTLADNSAIAGAGAGIYNFGNDYGAFLEVFNCTLSGNGIANVSPLYIAAVSMGDTILKNSPISSPYPADFTSYGYNLSSDSGGGFLTAAGDRINTDPKFDPVGLVFNGGPTQTIALANGSPAIDQGNAAGVPVDQRGVVRIYNNPAIVNASGGDGSDIGAYEAPADPLQGETALVVTTTADHNDGTCGGSDCTLREAIARTNALPGNNPISFASNVIGTITLLTAAGGELVITDSTTIVGPGARVLAISSNTQSRIMSLTAGMNIIVGLTLRDGWASGGAAGGSNFGGAVYNQSQQVTFRECTFRDNRASGSSGVPPGGNGGSGNGGAIANLGLLTVERCTFTGNGATGASGADNPPPDDFTQTTGGSGGSGRGGAIFNDTGRGLTVSNCTFSANNAGGAAGGSGHNGGSGGAGAGGAIYNLGTMVVTAGTFSGNGGFGGSGGLGRFTFTNGLPGKGIGSLASAGGTSTMRNTISAGNTGNRGGGPDVDGTFVSQGYNLIGNGDFGTGFNQTGDQTGTSAALLNAKLGPLQNNGGLTDTMRVLPGSPAFDQGHRFNIFEDQRSQTRPRDDPGLANAPGGDGSDIGAYEVGAAVFIVTTIDDHNDDLCSLTDCTLREAIAAANAQLDKDVIRFAPNVAGIIQLASALPVLNSDITIEGPGANVVTVRRNSGGDYRILTISNATIVGPVVSVNGLTLTNGNATGSFPNNSGGAIFNDHGDVTLSRVAITGNVATSFGAGGGVFNYGTNSGSAKLVVSQSTFSGNNGHIGGGAIYNEGATGGNATLVLVNTTFQFNVTGFNSAAIMNAGGAGTAVLTMTNCTLSGSLGPGIGNRDAEGTITLANNLLNAGQFGAATLVGGGIISQGHNLSSDAAGGDGGTAPGGSLNQPGDIRNTNPQLDPVGLTNNGGPIMTIALLAGSPAINAGGDALAPKLDQRNYVRVGVSDIGAFEFGGGPLRITSIVRLTNGRIVLQGVGVPSAAHTIERSLNLVSDSFGMPIQVTANAAGLLQHEDATATGLNAAFYRLSFP